MEQVHVLTWNSIDSWQDGRGFVVQAFGRLLNETSSAVCIEIEGFMPSFRLKISKPTTRRDVELFYQRIGNKIKGLPPKITFDSRFPLYPYTEYFDRFIIMKFNGETSRKRATDMI